MTAFLLNYLPIVIFLGIAAALGIVFIVGAPCSRPRRPTRKALVLRMRLQRLRRRAMKFDVRFYLVSILFIIFDLEVAFLFPGRGADEAAAGRRSSPSGR
jgi:NADH-quinone oxidoreductase subunit A